MLYLTHAYLKHHLQHVRPVDKNVIYVDGLQCPCPTYYYLSNTSCELLAIIYDALFYQTIDSIHFL